MNCAWTIIPYLSNVLILGVGQKCSALSRVYVSSSVWNGGFKDLLLSQVAKIKVGAPQSFDNFMGPVMFVSCQIYYPMYTHSRCVVVGLLMIRSWDTSKRPKKLVARFWLAAPVRIAEHR